MVDNDQIRRARGAYGRELVQLMGWLARTPDMNPIEHVRNCLQRRIVASIFQCGTREILERELVDDRGMIPLADILKLI